MRVESSGFRRETEKDGSLDTATALPSGASLERPEVWRSERNRRASIFRFRSAHKGKSFGIAADAEMMNVLPGVWFGSLTSIVDYISGLTAGSRLIPSCPLGKSSGIGVIAEMAEGFRAIPSVPYQIFTS